MNKAWKTIPLKDLTTKIGSGATPKGGKDSYKAEGISLIRSLNVYDLEFKKDKLAYIDDAQATKLSNVVVEESDVLFNITGASIARCCVVPKDVLPARVNQHVAILRAADTKLDCHFLCYLMISPDYKDLLLKIGDEGGSTRQAITKAQLQELPIPLPPLDEQKRIVQILDSTFASIDKAIENTEKNLANSSELFESELNAAIEESHENGKTYAFSDICYITSKLVDPREAEYQQMLHIGAGNMITASNELVGLQTAKEEGLISGKFIFDDSMVLYSKIRPYLRKVVAPDFSGLCSADIYPLKPDTKIVLRDYLNQILLSHRFTEYAILGSGRAGMPKVNRKHLFAYKVSLPDITIQKEIVSKISTIRHLTVSMTKALEAKLSALQELKQSILQKAFTGQLTADFNKDDEVA